MRVLPSKEAGSLQPRPEEHQMTTSCKLRIATADDSGALSGVAAEVRSATGLPVRPALQEIDGHQLIVELRLTPTSADSRSPRELAHIVSSTAPNLEVLSSWREYRRGAAPLRRGQPEMVVVDDDGAPRAARRAFNDMLPTAEWQPAVASHVSQWVLAVPVLGADGRMMAAMARRSGYHHRFVATEATALGLALVA
jgi:hypothetical protein